MKTRGMIFLLALFFVLGLTSYAQVLPYQRTGSLICSDTSEDSLFRLTDRNYDGDYNDPNEITLFYTDANLQNPIQLTSDSKGNIYYFDTKTAVLMCLNDMNGDGDAMDPGESILYIDNSNSSGVWFTGVQGMTCDTDGTMYLSNPGNGAYPPDFIAKAKDLNMDGDCQDAGEITVIYDHDTALLMGLMGINCPAACALDSDGYLYVSDYNTPTGDDAIIRMKDLNNDGDVYDNNELSVFYDSTLALYIVSFVDALAFNKDGVLFVNDFLTDKIYFCQDLNKDGDIHDSSEMILYRDGKVAGTPYSSHGIAISGENDPNWDVYCSEGGSSSAGIDDGVHGFADKNFNNVIDMPDEHYQVYQDTVGDLDLSNVKGLAFMKGAVLSTVGTPAINSSFDVVVDGTAYNQAALMVGGTNIPGGVLLFPEGLLELIPILMTPILPMGPDGVLTLTFNIPNDPNLVGNSFYLQAGEGDSYLYLLTNSEKITIQ